MNNDKRIIDLWNRTQSIKAVASETGLSHSTVRRRLIANDIYPSERSIQIKEYIYQGYTVEQISEKLKISVRAVQGHIKYVKGPYTGDSATSQWRKGK